MGAFAPTMICHQILKNIHAGEDSGFTFFYYYLIIDK